MISILSPYEAMINYESNRIKNSWNKRINPSNLIATTKWLWLTPSPMTTLLVVSTQTTHRSTSAMPKAKQMSAKRLSTQQPVFRSMNSETKERNFLSASSSSKRRKSIYFERYLILSDVFLYNPCCLLQCQM